MFEAIDRVMDRMLAPVPAFLMIVSGMTLLGVTLLMPAWLESRELAWKLGVMKVQAERMAAQEKSYRQFNEALAADDPVLLERLAFYHLRLKPAGSMPLVANASLPIRPMAQTVTPIRFPTIEEMLHKSLPRPGIDTPAYQPPHTRLVTLTTGPLRLGVLAAGVMCLFAGLTSPVRSASHDRDAAAYAAIEARAAASGDAEIAPQKRSMTLFQKLGVRLGRWGA